MYQIIVGELGAEKMDRRTPWMEHTLAESPCRISALSSADYCLRSRKEVDRGRIAFRGSKAEIHRLFEAERLDGTGLEQLSDQREYTVLFLGRPRLECMRPCAG